MTILLIKEIEKDCENKLKTFIIMKNKQKKYYENNKEKLQEQAQNKYRELSNE